MNAFNVTDYNIQIHAKANNPVPYDAFIGMNLIAQGAVPTQAVAFLNFYPLTTKTLPANSFNIQNNMKVYSANFYENWFAAAADLLRNEKPISFWFDETTKESLLGTGTSEQVGAGEK